MVASRGIPVRFGCTVISALSVAQAVAIAVVLNSDVGQRRGSATISPVFERVSPEAHEILEVLNQGLDLHGNAAKSLGRALRAKPNRQRFGDSFLAELSYIAHGADAVRHSTVSSINTAIKALTQVCAREVTSASTKIEYVAPAPVAEYFVPPPAATCAATVSDTTTPDPAVHSTPALVIEYTAPAPVITDIEELLELPVP